MQVDTTDMEARTILVVELKRGEAAEEWQAALNEPYKHGYYFVCTLGENADRAMYKRRQIGESADASGRNAPNRDGKEAAALDIIRANRALPVRQIVELLASAGIKRGRNWVSEKRVGIDNK